MALVITPWCDNITRYPEFFRSPNGHFFYELPLLARPGPEINGKWRGVKSEKGRTGPQMPYTCRIRDRKALLGHLRINLTGSLLFSRHQQASTRGSACDLSLPRKPKISKTGGHV